MRFRIKKGDRVRVIIGKDRGREGKVLEVAPKLARVLVEGVNLRKKHRRARARGQKGEIITLPRPIHISNVMLVCPSCAKVTRAAMRAMGGLKERVCNKCNAPI